jgi:hypothetical protein
MKLTQARVTARCASLLDDESKRTRIPKTQLLEMAVDQYLGKRPVPIVEQFAAIADSLAGDRILLTQSELRWLHLYRDAEKTTGDARVMWNYILQQVEWAAKQGRSHESEPGGEEGSDPAEGRRSRHK